MLTFSTNTTLIILVGLSVLLVLWLIYLLKQKKKKQLDKIFIIEFGLLLFWLVVSIVQIICETRFDVSSKYFTYLEYISVCFLPVAFLFNGLIFANTKITFKPKHLLLFVIPVLSMILLLTNDSHHLFYKKYSPDFSNLEYGKYFYVHQIYVYVLYAISLFILLKYSIKNSGIFSKQAILIFIGTAVPVVINLLGINNIISISMYTTPITFAIAVICFTLGMYKFNLLKVAPIALQRIVDRISDSYIIISEDYIISDFNQTLLETFKIKHTSDIRSKSLKSFLVSNEIKEDEFKEHISKIKDNDKTESFELYIKKLEKYFNIEITSIVENGQFLGILILFKDITEHIKDMKKVQDAQESMMESERLSSLGQLIGGIAHNLKTPIMSISGATEGLRELVDEYDKSIENQEVTIQDHHDIAKDMNEWIVKIRNYTEYMSDIITAVRGQAVTLSATEETSFSIDDLVKRVNILMNHELKSAQITMDVDLHEQEHVVIQGDINSLVQVVNNMISNAIQSYNGKTGEKIRLDVHRQDDNVVISIKDNGCGLPENVKEKLFKEMITTKGKNGTGLGMYMSYSTIKANFGGNITFESEKNEGTTFNVIIPIKK